MKRAQRKVRASDSKSGVQFLLYRGFESLSLRQMCGVICQKFAGR